MPILGLIEEETGALSQVEGVSCCLLPLNHRIARDRAITF